MVGEIFKLHLQSPFRALTTAFTTLATIVQSVYYRRLFIY